MSYRFELIQKYSKRLPRYTSYPPVPDWNGAPSRDAWFQSVAETANDPEGISLYIHLPYCEKLCTYCGCNKRITVNHAVEMPYVNDVLQEWESYRDVLPDEPMIAELHLGGGTPTFFSAKALDALLTDVLMGTRPAPNAVWSVEVHPSYTSPDQLEVLYKHGFRRISLGVQSLDRKVQFLINRIQPFEEVEMLTRTAREIGFTSVNYDILYGLPFQSVDIVQSDIRQLLKLRPDRVAFYGYAHVPWKHPGQRRYTEDDLPGAEERFESAELGRTLFEEAGYRSIGMDHFALPTDELAIAADRGTLHRNFMGYTEKHTRLMIGLGVSSISESPLGFVQNEKVIETYRERLQSGDSLFVNGHRFSKEDKRVRTHILDLMCNMHTQLDPYMSDADRELLHELEHDGLVSVNAESVTVNENGRAFLRSVCAVFDPNYDMNAVEQRYSINL